MKQKIKFNMNGLIVIIITIFLAVILSFQYKNNMQNKELNNALTRECALEENKELPLCIDFVESGKNITTNYGILTTYFSFLDDSVFGYLSAFGILIIGIVVLQKIKYDEAGKYYLLRQDYKSYLRSYLKKAFSCSFLIPIICFILFMCSCFISKTFDSSLAIQSNISTFPLHFLVMGWKFFLLMEVTLLIMSMLYTSLVLISYRIVNNRYIAVILSFLLLLVLEIFSEFLLVPFLQLVCHIPCHSYFNLINTLNFSDVPNIYIYSAIRLILVAIFFIVVIILYKDKESYIKSLEKMEGKKK